MNDTIGIYVGLFDPVHAGHIAFGLQAVQETRLDAVYFLPERMPLHKRPVEHYAHRVAMLGRALQPHPSLEIIETADKRFVATQTIPRLQAALHTDVITFLCTARSFMRLIEGSSDILRPHTFVVSVASKDELQAVAKTMKAYALPAKKITILDALRPDVATEYVQMALSRHKNAPGLLPSVARYAKAEWLYADLSQL